MKYSIADMMDDMFRAPFFGNDQLMKTDVSEKDGNVVLEIELPGYEKSDVKISLYNGNLTIQAERHEDENEEKGRTVKQERFQGTASRTYYVGDAINENDIHASFENGILTITYPTEEKKEEEDRKYIDIL